MRKIVILCIFGIVSLVALTAAFTSWHSSRLQFDEDEVIIRVAVYFFDSPHRASLVEVTRSKQIRTQIGDRAMHTVEGGLIITTDLENDLENVLGNVTRERIRPLRVRDFDHLLDLAHQLEESNYSEEMELVRGGGGGMLIYYNGIMYERSIWDQHASETFQECLDEIFKDLFDEILRLSPLRINIK